MKRTRKTTLADFAKMNHETSSNAKFVIITNSK